MSSGIYEEAAVTGEGAAAQGDIEGVASRASDQRKYRKNGVEEDIMPSLLINGANITHEEMGSATPIARDG